ncbi:hypothetical protein RRG08_043207 [Elysia crispata]|uniref:Uncharacterized protein n=1 Tax=Elysia crispata TaxID=231223 RepID=A0AAE0ZIG8_9GAST|nr:hypothetical protein RRG08_043207 [Elysia crispata]
MVRLAKLDGFILGSLQFECIDKIPSRGHGDRAENRFNPGMVAREANSISFLLGQRVDTDLLTLPYQAISKVDKVLG